MLKSFKRLGSVSLTFIFMLSLIIPAVIIPSTALASSFQTVTVDLNANNGAPSYRGSGFLYGLSEDGSAPVGALLSDLKPRLFRGGAVQSGSGGGWAGGGYSGYLPRFNSVLAQYNRANSLGANYQMLLSDMWYGGNAPLFPGDNGNWTAWNSFITQLVNDKKANNMTNARYDIWNEPDGAFFWNRSGAQYSEMWKRGVQLIRSLDANAVIVGPGYGGFNASQLSDWLDYAKANNALPNIMDWHFSSDPVADVQTVQALLTAKSITTITGFTIGEYIFPAQQNAGYTAWYLARLEKSGVLGANHAIWNYCCNAPYLDEILTPSLQKKGQWWTYKSYADMSGTLVSVTPSSSIDGVASKNSVNNSALILLGNNGEVTGDIDVNITNFNAASYLIGNGKAHVVVSWINNLDPVAAPVITQILDATVVNNSIQVTIPWNSTSDAFTIAITPFNPASPTPTPTPTPGSIVVQAEDATLSGGAVVMTDHSGYTGTGFVAGYGAPGPQTTFLVNVPSQGYYALDLRYANGSGSIRAISIYVNGFKIKQTSLPNLANWDTWGTRTETLILDRGYNTIAYKYDSSDSGPVNLDKLTVTPADGNVYQAENAALVPGAKVMTDHTGYTGTGFVAGYEQPGASTTFTVNAESQGNYNVELRYGNGSGILRTVSIYVNGNKIQQTSLPNLANWDTWGTKSETLSLNAGSNTIMYRYDSGDNGLINLDKITLTPSVYQLENGVLAGSAKVMTDHSGYTGTGFVAGFQYQGSSTMIRVNVASQGNYNVVLRYGNGSGFLQTVSIYVNGNKIQQTSLPYLANWDTWGTKAETLSLSAGNNWIMYKYDSGDSGTVNLDNITVSPN